MGFTNTFMAVGKLSLDGIEIGDDIPDPLFTKKWAAGGISNSKKLKNIDWMGRSKAFELSYSCPSTQPKRSERSAALCGVRYNSP